MGDGTSGGALSEDRLENSSCKLTKKSLEIGSGDGNSFEEHVSAGSPVRGAGDMAIESK